MTDSSSDELLDIEETQHAGRFRALNARWPWLKFAVFLLLGAAIVAGGFWLVHLGNEAEETLTTRQYSSLGIKPPVREKKVDFTGKKLVALTFDDGPSAVTTPRLLDILADKKVQATFFVVGNLAERNSAILQREQAEGHEIGSHSTGHQNLVKLSVNDLNANMAEMDRIFKNTLGKKVEIMRPPYGSINQTVRDTMPVPMILWTVDPEDWKYRDSVRVRSAVVGATFDGAIVLMHDIHATTVDAVAAIIDDLRAQGYEFLTVSELAEARGVEMKAGTAYSSFRP